MDLLQCKALLFTYLPLMMSHSLMYGAGDPSIAGMVLDSPFSDLVDLMMELVGTYKFPLPKFTVSHHSVTLRELYSSLIHSLSVFCVMIYNNRK